MHPLSIGYVLVHQMYQKRFFNKIRYTWLVWCQNRYGTKTKYMSHVRTPVIGQPPELSTLSSFRLTLAHFEPVRGHTCTVSYMSITKT